jgi:glycosyltransferase involved in cell wall biosynthesis
MTPSRKKILYVVTKSNWGGAQRYVYDLATSLPRERFDVAVACGGTGLLTRKLADAGIRTFSVGSFQRDIHAGKEFSSLRELWNIFGTFRPDVVHLNSSKAGGLGACIARLRGVRRIIFTAHGWPFWEPRPFWQRALIRFFSWLTVVCAHVTVCICTGDASVARRMPCVSKKITVIRNGIAPFDMLPRDEARTALFSPAQQEMHARDLWVLTTAEFTRNKNLFVGLDAVRLHNKTAARKIYYVLLSDGELRPRIERHITENAMDAEVALLGFVPDGQRFLRAFDAFFLPSLKEGVPYVLLEAGCAGLPCVASKTGGIPEIITSGVSGLLCDPHDTKAFAESLAVLSQNQDARTAFGEALQKTIATEFSREQMVSSTVALYED